MLNNPYGALVAPLFRPCCTPCCTPYRAIIPLIAPLSRTPTRDKPLNVPLVAPPYRAAFLLHLLLPIALFAPPLLGDLYSEPWGLAAMKALGAAGVCIGDSVEEHKHVSGTQRGVGPGLVLQAVSISASNKSLTFDVSTTFAHTCLSRPFFGALTG